MKRKCLAIGGTVLVLLLASCSYKDFEDRLRGEGNGDQEKSEEQDFEKRVQIGPEDEEGESFEDQGIPQKPQRELDDGALPNAGYYEVGETIDYTFKGETMAYTLKGVQIIDQPEDSAVDLKHFFSGQEDVERWRSQNQALVLVTAEIENISTEPNPDNIDKEGNYMWQIFRSLGYEEDLRTYSGAFSEEAWYFSEYVYGETDPHFGGWIELPIGTKKEIQLGWLVDKEREDQVMYWGLGSGMGDRLYFFRLGSVRELR